MVESRGDRPKGQSDRVYVKPESEARLRFMKNSRVTISNPRHRYFGKEGVVEEIGRNPYIRRVKLDGIQEPVNLTVSELE